MKIIYQMMQKPSLMLLKGKKTCNYFFKKLSLRFGPYYLLQDCNAAIQVFAWVQLPNPGLKNGKPQGIPHLNTARYTPNSPRNSCGWKGSVDLWQAAAKNY
ncbi:hypothetical protein G3570_12735 [Balneolaceae bacterium YR4-1]|uniref:Uncharacterized protein n=1 Tax=Halalkalibaculum roseum TaxID=2709311 RepID=A0A6M1T075_9BACT|nr:hypothetical protein [Halalkalibaculum roseum]NGP77506.1 hypothetical protein [Halalkalibaculum roseum]